MTEKTKTQFQKTHLLNGPYQVTSTVADVTGRGLGIRHLQVAAMALAAFMAYALRTNLSVAIVAMVSSNQTNAIPSATAETFSWGEDVQGYILSSFFWGYFVSQVPAGIITEKFGGHRFLCFAILGSSSFTLVVPQCAYYGGWPLVCINRMFQGICQGFVFTSIFTLLGVWSPPLERSTLSGFALSTQLLGAVAATPTSSFLCSAFGWPLVFYSFGATGIALGILLIFLGADTPAKHRLISTAERHYIEKSLGGAKLKMIVPWRRIFTSVHYWAALINLSLYSFVYLSFLTKIPTYLATVLKLSMEDNGLYSTIPLIVAWILCYVFSGCCDLVTNQGWLTLTAARKVFNSIAHFGSAVCIIGMAHAESNTASILLLTGFMGTQAATFAGVQANFVDLAPNFAGAIFSVGNFASAALGICGPLMVAFIVTEAGSVAQWRVVLYFFASAMIISNIFYLVFGTSETQFWNWPESYDDKIDIDDAEGKRESHQLKAV